MTVLGIVSRSTCRTWLGLGLCLVGLGWQAPPPTITVPPPDVTTEAPAGTNPRVTAPEDEVALDPFLLGAVQHRTVGILAEEAEAFEAVLAQARKFPPEKLDEAARINTQRLELEYHRQPGNAKRPFSLFAELLSTPINYSGELITLRGYIRTNIQQPADEDQPQAPPTYEAWLFTPDSQHHPTVIVYSDKPKDMPLGGDLIETVEVSGYFFKLYGYRAEDGKRVAPLLIARTMKWIPNIKPVDRNAWFRNIMIVCMGSGLVVIGLWWINRTGHRRRLLNRQKNEENFDPQSLRQILP